MKPFELHVLDSSYDVRIFPLTLPLPDKNFSKSSIGPVEKSTGTLSRRLRIVPNFDDYLYNVIYYKMNKNLTKIVLRVDIFLTFCRNFFCRLRTFSVSYSKGKL